MYFHLCWVATSFRMGGYVTGLGYWALSGAVRGHCTSTCCSSWIAPHSHSFLSWAVTIVWVYVLKVTLSIADGSNLVWWTFFGKSIMNKQPYYGRLKVCMSPHFYRLYTKKVGLLTNLQKHALNTKTNPMWRQTSMAPNRPYKKQCHVKGSLMMYVLYVPHRWRIKVSLKILYVP